MKKNNRGKRRKLKGCIVFSKTNKTITVIIVRKKKHVKYGKIIKKHKKYFVHDKNNDGSIGDIVSIIESNPVSKTKKWKLEKIINKSIL